MKWSDDEELLCNHNTNSFSSSTLLKLSGLGKHLCISIFWSFCGPSVVVTCIGVGWTWSILESLNLAKWHSSTNDKSDWLESYFDYIEILNNTLTGKNPLIEGLNSPSV